MGTSKEASPLFKDYWNKNYEKWNKETGQKVTYDKYNSPYTGGRRMLSDGNSTESRMLQGSSKPMSEAIQCLEPGDSISFAVNKKSFPVYIRNS